MKITILAGGSGTRLWPLSRASHPKQFIDVTASGRSLLQETVDRIRPLVAGADILVVTGREYGPLVARQLPDVPAANIIAEPCGRGSAPAIALAALTIQERWGNEVMASLHADHHVAEPDVLRRALLGAAEVARKGRICTLGIVPTQPQTGLGYIQRGRLVGEANGFQAFAISRFVEKPTYERAKEFVESGAYYWNTGMFVWEVQTILQEIEAYMPGLASALTRLPANPVTALERAARTRLWKQLRTEQIDIGVMEKTKLGTVVPVDGMGWNDVGSWNSLADIGTVDDNGNLATGETAIVDSTNCIVSSHGRRLVAAIGLHDMVVVETDDAILVCPRARAQDVRKMVEHLRATKRDRFV